MISTELLGAVVFADRRVGYVSDLRFVLDAEATDQPTPPARLYGLIISPHARSSSLGYERSGVRAPRPIAALVRWRHRGSFLVRWPDVLRIEEGRIDLRPNHQRYSAELGRSATVRPELDSGEFRE